MCEKQRLTPEELEKLESPAALAAMELLREKGWLYAQDAELNALFRGNEASPARATLKKVARFGGAFGKTKATLFLAALAGTVLALMFGPDVKIMSAELFVAIAVLGLAGSIILRQHPGYLNIPQK